MKNFQRNLFIVLALALCATCAYQWYLQGNQLATVENLNRVMYKDSESIQTYTNSIKKMDDEINQLHDRMAQLKQTIVSNDQWATTARRESARLKSDQDILTNEIAQYQSSVTKLTGNLKEAYDGEKKLAAQRDEFVQKLNDSIKAENEITAKYNELVDRFNKLQASAPATK